MYGRPHPAFGLGNVIPASANANAVSNAKEMLAELAPMAAGGGALFLVAKSLGASLLGATTAGIGGIVLASWVAMRGNQS